MPQGAAVAVVIATGGCTALFAGAFYRTRSALVRVRAEARAAQKTASSRQADNQAYQDLVRGFVQVELPALLANQPVTEFSFAAPGRPSEHVLSALLASARQQIHSAVNVLNHRMGNDRSRQDGWVHYLRTVLDVYTQALDTALEDIAGGRAPSRPVLTEPEGDEPMAHLARAVTATLAWWWDVTLSSAHQQHTARGRAGLTDVFLLATQRVNALNLLALEAVSELERNEEDPILLHGLFHVDQLLTRQRREIEGLAVLGGATARRAAKPVLVATVMRRAVAATEHYQRVRVEPPAFDAYMGAAAPDLENLLAELAQNGTRFSREQVRIRVHAAGADLVIEVEDQGGLPMSETQRRDLNQLLASPQDTDPYAHLKDGRIGLLVAARYAQRNRIRVELQPNHFGGTTAMVLVPSDLLAAAPAPQPDPHPEAAPATGPVAPPERQPGAAVLAPPPPESDADGRPVLPRRTRSGPTATAEAVNPQHREPTRAPTGDLMGRFASGARRASAEQAPPEAAHPFPAP
ncbi:ATP-binding protein [Kitasatospora sp. NPDC094028]